MPISKESFVRAATLLLPEQGSSLPKAEVSGRAHMKPNQTTLTKEDFIRRSMNGERFKLNTNEYYYDSVKLPPFRTGSGELRYNWTYFDGKTIFTVVTPKKTIMVEEWLVASCSGEGLYVREGTPEWFKINGSVNDIKLSGRTIEVEEKAQS